MSFRIQDGSPASSTAVAQPAKFQSDNSKDSLTMDYVPLVF